MSIPLGANRLANRAEPRNKAFTGHYHPIEILIVILIVIVIDCPGKDYDYDYDYDYERKFQQS
jgi:hypothetical protein